MRFSLLRSSGQVSIAAMFVSHSSFSYPAFLSSLFAAFSSQWVKFSLLRNPKEKFSFYFHRSSSSSMILCAQESEREKSRLTFSLLLTTHLSAKSVYICCVVGYEREESAQHKVHQHSRKCEIIVKLSSLCWMLPADCFAQPPHSSSMIPVHSSTVCISAVWCCVVELHIWYFSLLLLPQRAGIAHVFECFCRHRRLFLSSSHCECFEFQCLCLHSEKPNGMEWNQRGNGAQ